MAERSILLETEVVLKADSEGCLDQLEEVARQILEDELTGREFYGEEVPGSNSLEFCKVWVNKTSTPNRKEEKAAPPKTGICIHPCPRAAWVGLEDHGGHWRCDDPLHWPESNP